MPVAAQRRPFDAWSVAHGPPSVQDEGTMSLPPASLPPISFARADESFVALLASVRSAVDDRLAAWLAPRVAAAAKISADVALAAEAARGLALRGGKRMRAALVVAGFEALAPAPSSSWASCMPGMLAIELLQTYLLIHDDWMDDDDVRRGGPAVHVLLREQLGDRALGDAAAILAGDLASAWAQEALFESSLPAEHVLSASRAYARIQTEVVTGQLAEMMAGRPGRATPPRVETVHALKTASYTVTGPLLIGAALAGADASASAAVERFGRPLGVAFQLRDDLLGIFGDPQATGKPIWNDLRQGKRTALVAELLREPSGAELLDRVLGKPDASHDDLRAVVDAMVSSGAKERVERRVDELCDEARQAIYSIAWPIAEPARSWLVGAVRALGERNS